MEILTSPLISDITHQFCGLQQLPSLVNFGWVFIGKPAGGGVRGLGVGGGG